MSEPIGDPNLTVVREGGAGGGRLVITDEAVQRWVRGYLAYAATIKAIARESDRYRETAYFGDLDSLRQLASGYQRLIVGGEGSLHQRLLEFADAATDFAEKLNVDWQRIISEDNETAAALSIPE